MKANILTQSVSIYKLRETIDYYRKENLREYPKYLVMNRYTWILFKERIGNYFFGSDEVYLFENIPIAICEKLEDGDIDVI